MRILHLLASPVFSGPAELVLELALAQRSLGHDVTVAIDRKRATTTSEEPAAPRFQSAGLLDEGGLELSVKSSPARMLADIAKLRARSEDILHTHFSHDHLLARVAGRHVLVRSIHAPRSLRWSTPRADVFTVPYESLRPGAFVLPALISSNFRPSSNARAELQLEGAPIFGMVSTFQLSRRHALALDAFAILRKKHPRARLVLIGDGILGAELKEHSVRLGLGDSVVFPGYQSGTAFIRWMQALDEVWILGLGNDFSARAAVQARACGARVVGVAQGALPQWADAVIAPTVDALINAAGADDRRSVELPEPLDLSRQLLACCLR